MSVVTDSDNALARSHLASVGARPSQTRRATPITVVEGGRNVAASALRFLGTTLFATFVTGLVGALVLQATIIQKQGVIDKGRAEIAVLETSTEGLHQDLAALEAPARIVTEARRLGMIDAPETVYLNAPSGLLDDRTLTVAENQLRGAG